MLRTMLICLAVLFATPQTLWAGMKEDCIQAADPGLGINGCTAMIGSGQYSGKNLAGAYYNRGLDYWNLGEYSRAISDYDQAIRIDPGDADIYNNRGHAYEALGQNDKADIDYDQAFRRYGKARVKAYQKTLKKHGYYTGALDGIWGKNSRAASILCTADPNC